MTAPDAHEKVTRPPVALVTGAGQGIGQAIAEHLAAEGHVVYVNDLDGDRAGATVEAITGRGGSARSVVADVSDSAEVDAMFDQIEAQDGSLAVLVNNAGIGGNAAIRDVDDAYWERVIGVNLDSALACSRRALRTMREERRGAIVNVTSRAWLGWWGQVAYASAKAGVVGMTRALAVEMSSRNVRVNAVAPGLIETPMLLNRDAEALARLVKSVPIGRIGTPTDVARAVAFLASDRARAITGQLLYVCGGKSVYAYPDWD